MTTGFHCLMLIGLELMIFLHWLCWDHRHVSKESFHFPHPHWRWNQCLVDVNVLWCRDGDKEQSPGVHPVHCGVQGSNTGGRACMASAPTCWAILLVQWCLISFLFCFIFMVLGIEPWTSQMLNKCTPIGPTCQLQVYLFCEVCHRCISISQVHMTPMCTAWPVFSPTPECLCSHRPQSTCVLTDPRVPVFSLTHSSFYLPSIYWTDIDSIFSLTGSFWFWWSP